MDYFVRAKRVVDDERVRGPGTIQPFVYITYLRGIKISYRLSEEEKKEIIKEELKKAEIKLDHKKWWLQEKETITVIPNPSVAPKTRQFDKPIFEDPVEIEIPEEVRKRHNKKRKQYLRENPEEKNDKQRKEV